MLFITTNFQLLITFGFTAADTILDFDAASLFDLFDFAFAPFSAFTSRRPNQYISSHLIIIGSRGLRNYIACFLFLVAPSTAEAANECVDGHKDNYY